MNIFYLDENPITAAEMLCDQHVRKMLLESTQMLSTAHRVLDGEPYTVQSESSGRNITRYRLPDERDHLLYNAGHVNHPCSVWVRESCQNYYWLLHHSLGIYRTLVDRLNAQHKSAELLPLLARPPQAIRHAATTPPAQAMPDDCRRSDAVTAYRHYYRTHKATLRGAPVTWTNREQPEWWSHG